MKKRDPIAELKKARHLARQLKDRKDQHEGAWLTKDAALPFTERAKKFTECNGQDIGRRRALREELQAAYGLTDLEAINVLNGYHISLYVAKYTKIRLMIPTDEELKTIHGDMQLLLICLSELINNDN